MKNSLLAHPSRLALRSAVISGFAIGVADIAISVSLFENTFNNSLPQALILAIASVILVYFILYKMQHSRLEALNHITQNIAQKRFEDYNHLSTKNRDELDRLVDQNIRASKTVEQEIQRLNRIENYRKEFIGDISHELKTPIFAIQGFVETLLDGAIEDQEVNRQFLEKAQRNIKRLILLTNDLMEISKLETGELKSNIRNIYLKEIIIDVVESLQYKAKKEHIEIHIDEMDNNLLVNADRNQIKQVLLNLVENAIKYNRQNGSVTVGFKDYAEDNRKVLVYVQDTGIGIDEEYIDRVTERFFRVDKSRARYKGGTGLGLAIAKHIMEAHGQEFLIKSTPGEGSTFSFTLTKA